MSPIREEEDVAHDWDVRFNNRNHNQLKNSIFFYLAIAAILILFLAFLYIPTLVTILSDREFVRRSTSTNIDDIIKYQVPMIDGHNDLPIQLKDYIERFGVDPDLRKEYSVHDDFPLQTDIPRLKQSDLGAQLWSVYLDCSKNDSQIPVGHGLMDERNVKIVHRALSQIQLIKRMIAKYDDYFVPASSAQDILDHFTKSQSGKARVLSSLLGMEGGHMIGEDLTILRSYYDLGVRYLTLTHTCSTNWAKSASDSGGPQQGLSEFGIKVVKEMNKLGMMIDLSHTHISTMESVLRESAAPVIFSHSNSFAVCQSARNVPDDMLLKLKANRGIIMINYYPAYLKNEERLAWEVILTSNPNKSYYERCDMMKQWQLNNPEKRASIDTIVAHIDHIKKITGSTDNIGLGSDFDGICFWTKGLDDVTKHRSILEALHSRGYTRDEIRNIAGGNMLRVMRDVEKVAAELNKDRREQPLNE